MQVSSSEFVRSSTETVWTRADSAVAADLHSAVVGHKGSRELSDASAARLIHTTLTTRLRNECEGLFHRTLIDADEAGEFCMIATKNLVY